MYQQEVLTALRVSRGELTTESILDLGAFTVTSGESGTAYLTTLEDALGEGRFNLFKDYLL